MSLLDAVFTVGWDSQSFSSSIGFGSESPLGHCYLEPTVLDRTYSVKKEEESNNALLPTNIASFIFPEGVRLRYAKEIIPSNSSEKLYPTYFTDDYLLPTRSSTFRNQQHYQRRRSLSLETIMERRFRTKHFDTLSEPSSSNPAPSSTTAIRTAPSSSSAAKASETRTANNNFTSLLRKWTQPTKLRTESPLSTFSALQYKVPPPKYKVTILTKDNGSYYYVHSLVFYKQVTMDQQTLLEQRFRVHTPPITATSLSRNDSLCSDYPLFVSTGTRISQRSTLYIQQAVSILSSVGDSTVMKRILLQMYLIVARIMRPNEDADVHLHVLFSLFASRNHAVWNIPSKLLTDSVSKLSNDVSTTNPPVITLYAYIQYLLSASIPRSSHTLRIPSLFSDVADPIFAMPDRSALPATGGSNFTLLVQCFSARTLLTVWKLILLEQKILIHSTVDALLAPLCEALIHLLFPLKWAGVYIPSLPSPMRHLLECPTPFIIGLSTRQLPHNLNDDIYIVDINHDRVTRGWVHPPTVTVVTNIPHAKDKLDSRSGWLTNVEPKILRLRRYAHDDCLYGSDSLGDPFAYPSGIAVSTTEPLPRSEERNIDIELPDEIENLFTECLNKIADRTGIRPGFGVPRYSHRLFPTKRLLILRSQPFGWLPVTSSWKDNLSITMGTEKTLYDQITNAEMYDQRNEELIRNELRNCALLSMSRLLSGYRSHVLWKSTVSLYPTSTDFTTPVHVPTVPHRTSTEDDDRERTLTRLSSFRTLSSIPTNLSQAIGSPSSEHTESIGSFIDVIDDYKGDARTARPPVPRTRAHTFGTVSSSGGKLIPITLVRRHRGESSADSVQGTTNLTIPPPNIRSYQSSPLTKPLSKRSDGEAIDTDELHLDEQRSNAAQTDHRPSSVSNISGTSIDTFGGTVNEPFRERLMTFASLGTRLTTVSGSLHDTDDKTTTPNKYSDTVYRKQRPIRPLRIYSPHPTTGQFFPSTSSSSNGDKRASSTKGTKEMASLCFIFDSRRFLACSTFAYVTFLRELIETQAFVAFLQLRAQVPTYLSSPPLSLSSPAATVIRKRRGSSASRASTPREATRSIERTNNTVLPSASLIPRLPPQSFIPIPPRNFIPTETTTDASPSGEVITKSSTKRTLDCTVSFFDACVDTVRRWPNLVTMTLSIDRTVPSLPLLSEIGQYGPSLAASSHGRCICGEIITALSAKNKETTNNTLSNSLPYRMQRHMRKVSAPAMVTSSTGTNLETDATEFRCTYCGLCWSHHPIPLTSIGILPLSSGITDTVPMVPSLLSQSLTDRIYHTLHGNPSLYLPILYGYWPNNLVQDHTYILKRIQATELTVDVATPFVPVITTDKTTVIPSPSLATVITVPQTEPILRIRSPNKLRIRVPKESSPTSTEENKYGPLEQTNTSAITLPITAPALSVAVENLIPSTETEAIPVPPSLPKLSLQHHEIILQNLSSILGIVRNECIARQLSIEYARSTEPVRRSTPSPDDSEIYTILRTPINEPGTNIQNILFSSIRTNTVPILLGRNKAEEEWDNRIEDIDNNKITVYQWGTFHTVTIYLNYIEYVYAQLHWSKEIYRLTSILSSISILSRVFITVVRLGSRIGITTTEKFPASVPSTTPLSIKYSIPLTIEGSFRIILHLLQLASIHPLLSSNDKELLGSTLVYVMAQLMQTTPSTSVTSLGSSSPNWNNELVRSVLSSLHSDTVLPLHHIVRSLILKNPSPSMNPSVPPLPVPIRFEPYPTPDTESNPLREIHSLWFSCFCLSCAKEISLDTVLSIHQGYVSEEETLALWNTNPRNSLFPCGVCQNPLSPRIHLVRWIFRYVSEMRTKDTHDTAVSSSTSSSILSVAALTPTNKLFDQVWQFDRITVTAYPYLVPSSMHLFTDTLDRNAVNADSSFDKLINLRWIFHRLLLPMDYVPVDDRIYRSKLSVKDLFVTNKDDGGGSGNFVHTLITPNGEVTLTKTLSLLHQCHEDYSVPYVHSPMALQSVKDILHRFTSQYSLGIGTVAPVYPSLLPVTVPLHPFPTIHLILHPYFRPLVMLFYHGQITQAVKYFINQRRIYRTYQQQKRELSRSDTLTMMDEMEPDIGLGGTKTIVSTWNTTVAEPRDHKLSSENVSVLVTKETLNAINIRDETVDITRYYPWEACSIFKTFVTLAKIYAPYLLNNIYDRPKDYENRGGRTDQGGIVNASADTLANLTALYTNGFTGTAGIGVLSGQIFSESLGEWILQQSLRSMVPLTDTRISASYTGTNVTSIPFSEGGNTNDDQAVSVNRLPPSTWKDYFGLRYPRSSTNAGNESQVVTQPGRTLSGQSFEEVIADALVREIEEEALYYQNNNRNTGISNVSRSQRSIITANDWPSTKLTLEIQRQFGYSSV